MRFRHLAVFLFGMTYGSSVCIAQMNVGASAGALYGGLPGAGAEVTFNLGPQISFGGAFIGGSVDTSSTFEKSVEKEDEQLGLDIEESSITRMLGLAVFKFYPFFTSFNIGLTMGFGNVTSVLKATTDESDAIDDEWTYRQSLAALTFGNRWRWDHFFIGIDWLGYMAVMSSDSELESNTSDDINPDLAKAREDYASVNEMIGEQGGPIAVVATIGTGF